MPIGDFAYRSFLPIGDFSFSYTEADTSESRILIKTSKGRAGIIGARSRICVDLHFSGEGKQL